MTLTAATQAKGQALVLSQQYPPWCILHMLLKRHKHLFSTILLEELLAPSPASLTPASSPSHSQSSSSQQPSLVSPVQPPPRPKALLSRYLIQRLHFGYYGTKRVLPESAVRYLTARARLEFGYFVIRGRAFWSVCQEDMDEDVHDIDRTASTSSSNRGGGDKKSRVRNGEGSGTQGLSANQRQQQASQINQQQQQGHTQAQSDDQGGNKDEDPYSLAYTEASTLLGRRHVGVDAEGRTVVADEAEQRRRMVEANQRCEEREEKLLMLEAVRYLDRQQPDMYTTITLGATSTSSSESPAASPEKVAAVSHWMRVALTSQIDSQTDMETADSFMIPASPFLNRRIDAFWMGYLQHPPLAPIELKSHTTKSHQVHGGMQMVQDDARLFQIVSGIFDGLATLPKTSRLSTHSVIEGSLSISPDTLRRLIFDYGYLPLPEDDEDRKFHYKGGIRDSTDERNGFPSNGSHLVNNRGMKGQRTSIWYFYDLQRVEVMTVYLMFAQPEVLYWMFDCGFEFKSVSEQGDIGVSPALLLQCCLPGCHAMLRHTFQLTPRGFKMPTSTIIRVVKDDLLGDGVRSKRIEFRRQDFVQVLKGVPSPQIRVALDVMLALGMEHSVVQDQLMGLLQTPGGLSPVNVELEVLSALFARCIRVDKTSPSASSDGIKSHQDSGKDSMELVGILMKANDIVNVAIQQAFDIQMDLSAVRDQEWKRNFEETLLNLKPQAWIVHPQVSTWVPEFINATEPAFQICFDHAVMEALTEILEWNDLQLEQLQKWTQAQENEAQMRSIRSGRQWEEVKRQLLVVHNSDDEEDELMGQEEASGEENWIGLDVEWTTNDQVELATTAIVGGMSIDTEMVRISDDGHLLLDNGRLGQGFSPNGQRGQQEDEEEPSDTSNNQGTMEEEESPSEVNSRLYTYLKKGAVVEEKHLIWVALGLVTESFRGRRVAEIQCGRSKHKQQHKEQELGPRYSSIQVKMACSPDAYRLVWMLASAYIRQYPLSIPASESTETATWTISSAEAETAGTSITPTNSVVSQEDPKDGHSISYSPSLTALPLSPTPDCSTIAKVKELRQLLIDKLGADARLMMEILNDIEDSIEGEDEEED
ncbi:hypothetical protein BG011_001766 [Mortierella polycephala]|uniref:Uncharacterized protein n=1 Tax=Mortierella polycephala TaxID=41804 RepID=A0A9P6QIC1_9FUNG|nr:hypothetical protein BG011_001766 [Mortierella polycephala]